MYTQTTFRSCRVHFCAFFRQPFSKQLYTKVISLCPNLCYHSHNEQKLLCRLVNDFNIADPSSMQDACHKWTLYIVYHATSSLQLSDRTSYRCTEGHRFESRRRPGVLIIYTNHAVGNFMCKHFMTELDFTEEGNGSKCIPKFTENTEKSAKSAFPQTMVHNLQNVPNGITWTIWFSNRNFRFQFSVQMVRTPDVFFDPRSQHWASV